MSWGTDLADEVVQKLNGKSDWSCPFTAKRVPYLSVDLRETLTLQAQVFCAKEEEKRQARRFRRRQGTVQIALLWHTDSPLETDATLGTLADEIRIFLTDRALKNGEVTQIGIRRVAPVKAFYEQRICSVILEVDYGEIANFS